MLPLAKREVNKLKNVARRVDGAERLGDGRMDLQLRYEN